MVTVLHDICTWIQGQPFWQQAALEKALARVPLIDSDYDELFRYLQEDAQLLPRTGKRPELIHVRRGGSTVRPKLGAPRLVAIANVRNVNALDPDQRLTFGPAVTLVYGHNGSGKSGYARLLAHAGRSRDDAELLPNVLAPASSGSASAELVVNIDGAERTVRYELGKPCPELAALYVFDSNAASKQLIGANPFFYSPGDLRYLGELSRIVDQVRARVEAAVQQRRQPFAPAARFPRDSAVGVALAGLSGKTNIAQLERLGTLSADERRRMEQLDAEIAQLRTKQIGPRRDGLNLNLADLEELERRVRTLEEALGEHALADVRRATESYRAEQERARAASVEQFNTDGYGYAGTRDWHELVSAASRLVGGPDRAADSYPQPGDHCPLCRQELDAEARDLLERIWRYLDARTTAGQGTAQNEAERLRQALGRLDFDFLGEQSVHYRLLQEREPALLGDVLAFVAAAGVRRDALLDELARLSPATSPPAEPPMLPSVVPGVQALRQQLLQEKAQLEADDPLPAIRQRQAALDELRRREELGALLPAVREHVEQQRGADVLHRLRPSTTNITQVHNRLFDQLVTDRYLTLFEAEVTALGRPLRVTAATRGQKGVKVKNLALALPAGATPNAARAAIDRVLSDGEKQAVALADFLTEVALDEESAGMVLDDPVSTLDEEWMQLFAARLVDEAARRQVVIFTHNLPFALAVREQCAARDIDVLCHRMLRSEDGALAGRVGPFVVADSR